MKKILILIVSLTILLYFQKPLIAGDINETDLKSKMPETLSAAYKKCIDNVSYKMVSKTNIGEKAYESITKAYFKDEKTYRFENEIMGSETITVVTPEGAWSYAKNDNTITNMNGVQKGPLEFLSKGYIMTEGKEGTLSTFMFELKVQNNNCIVTIYVDTKDNLILKTITKNMKGETVMETLYSDFKFEKQDDSLFKKPQGAKEKSTAINKQSDVIKK